VFFGTKTSNLVPKVFEDKTAFKNYLRDVDSDLDNVFQAANPFLQFGTGTSYSVLTYATQTNLSTYSWFPTIGAWNITNTLLYGGSGASYIGLQPNVGIWLGDAAFNDAVFSVDPNGVLKAHSGEIGGWRIGTTTISSANIVIDSGNENIRSNDYVSGALGAGWQIDTDKAEFNNVRIRGKVVNAVFEKDTISTIGGNLLVADGDILGSDMSAKGG